MAIEKRNFEDFQDQHARDQDIPKSFSAKIVKIDGAPLPLARPFGRCPH